MIYRSQFLFQPTVNQTMFGLISLARVLALLSILLIYPILYEWFAKVMISIHYLDLSSQLNVRGL